MVMKMKIIKLNELKKITGSILFKEVMEEYESTAPYSKSTKFFIIDKEIYLNIDKIFMPAWFLDIVWVEIEKEIELHSIEMFEGQRENIEIWEMNGVQLEPAHFYTKRYVKGKEVK